MQCQPEPELEPRVKPFFNWRSKSIVHSWLYFEHHFFTSLSKMSPTKPDFAKSDRFSVVPSSRTQCGLKIKGGSFLSVNTSTMVSGTLHFDLFAIICFFAQGLLALRLLHFSPNFLVVLPGLLNESSTIFLSLFPQ